MKTKIKLLALVAGLVSVLPMTSAWASGGGSKTYYAALMTQVSSTGGGKVYAGTSQTPGTYGTSSTSSAQSSTTQNASKDFYAFAQADSGFEFAGWSKTNDGTDLGTASPYKVTLQCNSTTSPNATTYYATFKKKLLDPFGITFETSDAGTYTVDGVAPANKAGLTEATTVKLASSDPSFLNWRVNGAVVTANPYDLTCIATTTVSAEFLTADQVAEVATFAELTAALANDGKRKITIPSGVDITIAKSATVTVPAGKQLVVNGGLLVVGTLANSGAISGNGTIFKISYLIEQGEIKKPLQVTGEEWGNMSMTSHTGYKPYYRVTTTTANTPTVPSTISGCASSWAVLFKDKAVKISKQSPKALAVTRDTADSASTIKSIADNANVDEISASSDYVLLQDCTISGPLDGSSRVSSQKAYDCAGHKATISASKIAGSNMLFMNGSVALTPSNENQNSKATFINCSSITLKKIKGVSPAYYFYDCGSAGALASLSFAFYNNKSDTTNYRKAYFYSGYYSYTFSSAADATDGGGHSYVYNGSFSSDPTAYLQQSASPNGLKAEGTNPYKVVENVAAVNCVQVGGTQYASLAEAVSAVSSSGTLSLILPVTLKEKLVVPSGKKITIDLNGLNLSGGSIENSGTLRFEDNSGAAQPGTLSTPVVGKAGTIDITFGSYAGTFTMEGGVLTTHNGTFASSFAATEAGGQVLLKGGHFDGAVAIPDGYCQRSGYIGQKVIGHIADASRIGDADVSYLVTGFNPNDDLGLGASDETLYVNFMQSKSGWSSRSDFIGREALWDRLAELRSVGEPIKGQAFEASISFDRAVDSGTVSGWAKILGSSREMAMDQDLGPDEDYHILIPLVTGAGYTAKSFKHMFDGEDGGVWAQVHCGVENNSLDNIGTTVTLKFQIRMGGQKAGYTFDTERSRSYKFTGKGAIYGDTDYTSLAAAIEQAADDGTIRLSKDCGETITVGKEVSFTLDKNSFAFSGTIKADEANGFCVKRNGEVWTIFRKATETPVEIKAEDGDTSVAAVEVEDAWAEEVVQGSGVENPSDEQKQEIVQEALRQTEANGLKVWENKVLEQAEAKQTVTETGFAKVSKTEVTVDDKVVTATSVKEEIAGNANLADQETGTYQATVIVPDAKGVKVAIADTKATAKSVIKNDSAEKTVVLAIPNDVTVATAIATVPQENDQIKVYDTDKQGYRCWEFKNSKWTPINTETENGNIQNDMDATNEVLRAGSVILYEHSKVSVGQKVSVVTDYKKDVASEPAEVPTKTDGSDPKWNLMANPTGEDFELNKIIENETADNKTADFDKIIVLPKSGLGQKTYEKGLDKKKWGYYKTVEEEVNGRWVSRRVWVSSEDEKPVVPKGQSMWYISNGGNPKIKWNK